MSPPPVPDTGAPATTPPPAPVHGTLAEAARQVMEQAVAPQAAQGQAEPARHADQLKPLSGRVAVNWGGAIREIDIDETVKEMRERETLEALRASQRAELQSLGGAYAIQQAVDQMTAEQRQALAEVVKNPSLLGRVSAEAPSDPFSAEPTLPQEQPKPGSRAEEMTQIKQALAFLLQDAQQRHVERTQTNRERDMDSEMDRWPLLKNDAGARKYVKDQVTLALAQNQGADVRQIVGSHVAALTSLLSARQPATPGQEPPVGLIPARQPPPRNGIAASANDILRGKSLAGAAAFLQRFAGAR